MAIDLKSINNWSSFNLGGLKSSGVGNSNISFGSVGGVGATPKASPLAGGSSVAGTQTTNGRWGENVASRIANINGELTPNYGSEGVNVKGGVAGKRLNLSI